MTNAVLLFICLWVSGMTVHNLIGHFTKKEGCEPEWSLFICYFLTCLMWTIFYFQTH